MNQVPPSKSVNEGTRKAIPFDSALEQILSELEEDVEALGVQREIRHLKIIQSRGTSAHQQLWLYRALRRRKMPPKKAMQVVSKWLLESTEAGDFTATDAYGVPVRKMANGSRAAGLTADLSSG